MIQYGTFSGSPPTSRQALEGTLSGGTVSRIFISHSSNDTAAALALTQWLAAEGLDDVFLDAHPERGLATGETWLGALGSAVERCQVMLAMVSSGWMSSDYCRAEYSLARLMGRRVVVVLLEPGLMDRLPATMLADTQVCALAGAGANSQFSVAWQGRSHRVKFLREGLGRLSRGLRKAGLVPGTFPWPPSDDPDRAPYRGLSTLDGRDAAVFFGRDGELAACTALLQAMRATSDERILTLIAGSGAGKSSFLRAGLLPRLQRDDEVFLPLDALRPGGGALSGDAGLARVLVGSAERLGVPTPWTLGDVAARLNDEPGSLHRMLATLQQHARAALVDDAPRRPPTVVITVDQAEELFAAGAGPEASRLLAMLAEAIEAAQGPSSDVDAPLVIFAIRSDHFESLRTAPQLLALKARLYDGLRPLDRAHYKEVITGPARVSTDAGRPIELDAELVDRLLADAEGADALPLLALALARLVRDRGAGGRLELAHYLAFGGLGGIVEREAEHSLSADPRRRQGQLDALRSAFIPWLVSVEPDTGRAVRRRATLAVLPARAHEPIEALVTRRLLLRDRTQGVDTVEVAHEALLRQWSALAGWIEEARGELAQYRAAEREALSWDAAGRPRTSQWQHERLQLFRATLERLQLTSDRLPDPLDSFLRPEAHRLVDELADPSTPIARRVSIGERLATIGDLRRGVGIGHDGVPDIDWCEVPPMPGRRRPFYLSRYLVTIAQFEAFAAAAQLGLGTPVAGARAGTPATAGNHPQTAPDMATLQAFCRWLNDQLGRRVGLPTAAQLLWAACGSVPQNQYPWGPLWVEGRCNTRETGLLRPVAVGLFPDGASPQGIHDLAGQLWEIGVSVQEQAESFGICDSDPSEGEQGFDLPGPLFGALVGGSWYSCAQRAGQVIATVQTGASGDVGFRLVSAAPSTRWL